VRVVAFALTIGATIWGTTSGLRSDVRDILTQLRAESEKRELQERLVEERMGTMRETVNDLRRRLELTQIQVGDLREMILKLPQR
jgi:hypothetical protein